MERHLSKLASTIKFKPFYRLLFFLAVRPGLSVTPGAITTPPWQLIRFYCISTDGQPMTAMFSATRQVVEGDPRYRVRQLNRTTLEVVAPRGLRGPEDSTQIE